MFLYKYFFIFITLWKSLLFFLTIAFILNIIIFAFIKYNNYYANINFFQVSVFKILIVTEFIFFIFFFFILFYFYFYFYILQGLKKEALLISYKDISFFSFFPIKVDLFGLVIFFLALIVGFLSHISIEGRISKNTWQYLILFNYFLIAIYFLVSTLNYFVLFLSYEMLLIPSFFLIYNLSYVKKSAQASFYFLIWTQIGSLIVLCSLLYAYKISGTSNISLLKLFKFIKNENIIILTSLFIGFGIKVPIWPFHYWLTKVHVESPTSFSIFLSGFLVKTAIFSFFKISLALNLVQANYIFIAVLLMGIVDSSMKFWGQQDIKKLVAYCTIQEMNLIFIFFLYGDSNIINCGIFFCVIHAIMSSLMFFLVECIFKRFSSRSIIAVNGILQRAPNLGIYIFLLCIFYGGLPFTAKFSCEFYLFSTLFLSYPLFFFIAMVVVNFFGIIGFSRVWFNSIFCYNNKDTYKVIDLTFKEHIFICFCFFFLFFVNYFFFLIF